MNPSQLYLSTIDPLAGDIARREGLGVEIAEFCTAINADDLFEETNASVARQIAGIPRRILHGPFNELFPCAISGTALRRKEAGAPRRLQPPAVLPLLV